MKIKRILAWIIDWNLSGVPALLYALVFREIVKADGGNAIGILLFALFVISFPTIFVFRDVIFRGQSIAKRLFGLRIVDHTTGELPKKEKLMIRNLFFFIYPIELILLIATGKTIGDMLTNTGVIQK